MEVRIRLQKAGASTSKRQNYRVVAIGRAKARQARALEILGYYDPSKKPASFKVDVAGVEKWVAKGAVVTDTVRTLIKKFKKAA